MLKQLGLNAAAFCCLICHCFGAEERALPAKTSELIKLIDADRGSDPDLGYRLLMEQLRRVGRGIVRHDQEVADKSFQAALDRWAHRSSGITLKFALTIWNHTKEVNKQPISRDEIAWLIELMGNGKYSGLTEKEWNEETKRLLPYRFRFSSPSSILTQRKLESQELIIAALNCDLPHVRAQAIGILAGRVKWGKTIDASGIEDQLVRLSADTDLGVRTAVADALGVFKTDDPQRAVRVLVDLAKQDDVFLVKTAIYAIRSHAANVSPDQAADLLRATMRLSGSNGGRAVSTLKAIAEQATIPVCDKLIEVGIPIWKDSGQGESKLIEVLAVAARRGSVDQRERVAEVLCNVIHDSDSYDEMAAVMNVGPLGEMFSPSSQHAVMEELMQIIEGTLKDRKVRISQAAGAAAQIAPHCGLADRRSYVSRLHMIVKKPGRVQAVAGVLGALGSDSALVVSDLTQLMESKEGLDCVAAARALSKIKPDAKLCAQTYIRVMNHGPDHARRAAKSGLLEMGNEALVVGDELVELLKHERCYFLIEDVFKEIGPAAQGLSGNVKQVLNHENKNTRSAAKRVLAFISRGDASD